MRDFWWRIVNGHVYYCNTVRVKIFILFLFFKSVCRFLNFILIFFDGLECIGLFFAYVAHVIFLRSVWIRTQRAAVANRSAILLATHLPNLFIHLPPYSPISLNSPISLTYSPISLTPNIALYHTKALYLAKPTKEKEKRLFREVEFLSINLVNHSQALSTLNRS